jgi:chemotaxis methyl-accepting protein methylase
LRQADLRKLATPLDDVASTPFRRLFDERYGLRLAADQVAGLGRNISQIIARSDYLAPSELFDAISSGTPSALLEELLATVTIGETHFLRVGPQIDALRDFVFPELLGRRSVERRRRL